MVIAWCPLCSCMRESDFEGAEQRYHHVVANDSSGFPRLVHAWGLEKWSDGGQGTEQAIISHHIVKLPHLPNTPDCYEKVVLEDTDAVWRSQLARFLKDYGK